MSSVERMEQRVLLSTYSVTSTSDSGPGSLRQAILDANAHPGPDTIAFAIDSGVQTISAAGAFPAISDPVIIDGTTQPGYAGKPIVQVTGFGLEINAGHSTVRGLVLGGEDRLHGIGLYLHGGGDNLVQGNYFGTDPSGKIPTGGGFGIDIENSSANRIGGTTPGEGNLISGNGGVVILDDDSPGVLTSLAADGLSDDNVIQGNLIGTDADGNFGPGLGDDEGIEIAGGRNLLIGGNLPGARNVISGNDIGIAIEDDQDAGIRIQGNYIGTDAAGTTAVALRTTVYGEIGISGDFYAPGTLIGGPDPGDGNLISGCPFDGIFLDDSGAIVQGNRIGTEYTGTQPLAGSQLQYDGIEIAGGDNNLIGGEAPGAANVIAFNQTSGVGISTSAGSGNSVLGNSIFANGRLGIDLKEDGPTLNTSGSPHDGPNHLQSFPIVTSAATGTSATTVAGSLQSTPNAAFHFEFFSNPAAGPSGYGQGQTYLGAVTVMTDASGAGSFTFSTLTRIAVGQFVSATATSPSGDTSEFGQDIQVRLAGDVTGDAKVDFTDLLVLAQHYGRPGALADGDLNGDGRIDFPDLLMLAQNYGSTPTAQVGEVALRSGAGQTVASARAPGDAGLFGTSDLLPRKGIMRVRRCPAD